MAILGKELERFSEATIEWCSHLLPNYAKIVYLMSPFYQYNLVNMAQSKDGKGNQPLTVCFLA